MCVCVLVNGKATPLEDASAGGKDPQVWAKGQAPPFAGLKATQSREDSPVRARPEQPRLPAVPVGKLLRPHGITGTAALPPPRSHPLQPAYQAFLACSLPSLQPAGRWGGGWQSKRPPQLNPFASKPHTQEEEGKAGTFGLQPPPKGTCSLGEKAVRKRVPPGRPCSQHPEALLGSREGTHGDPCPENWVYLQSA